VTHKEDLMKNVLIFLVVQGKMVIHRCYVKNLKGVLRKKGNSVELIRLSEKKIGYCRACNYCVKNNGICVFKR